MNINKEIEHLDYLIELSKCHERLDVSKLETVNQYLNYIKTNLHNSILVDVININNDIKNRLVSSIVTNMMNYVKVKFNIDNYEDYNNHLDIIIDILTNKVLLKGDDEYDMYLIKLIAYERLAHNLGLIDNDVVDDYGKEVTLSTVDEIEYTVKSTLDLVKESLTKEFNVNANEELQESYDDEDVSLDEHTFNVLDFNSFDYPSFGYFYNHNTTPTITDPIEFVEIENGIIEIKKTLTHVIKTGEPIDIEFNDETTLEVDAELAERLLELDLVVLYKALSASSLYDFVEQLSFHTPYFKSVYEYIDDRVYELDTLPDISETVYALMDKYTLDEMDKFIQEMNEQTGLDNIGVVDGVGTLDVINNNRKTLGGRIDIVNRVRDGKVERNKRVSNTAGFRIKDGKVIKMSFDEKRKRKLGAKLASRKRKQIMSRILKKRERSNIIRQRRL